jgi:hypothetical protein
LLFRQDFVLFPGQPWMLVLLHPLPNCLRPQTCVIMPGLDQIFLLHTLRLPLSHSGVPSPFTVPWRESFIQTFHSHHY